MIDFKNEIAQLLSESIEGLTTEEIAGMLEIPTDSKMGDYAFPCFRLAKALRKAPPVIALEIAEKLAGYTLFAEINPVNAYVNMFLNKAVFTEAVLKETALMKEKFGSTDVGQGRKVIVEYSSPNIAKPFHIGHIRSTVIGNSIYKLYHFLGYDTVRINHLGDYGTQFGKMIVAYRRWGNKEAVEQEPIKSLLSYYVKFHEEVEQHPELEDEARAVFSELENGSTEEVALWQWFREVSLKEFSRVYAMLGIDFDSYAGESFYSDKMERVVKMMQDKNLLQESEGAQIVDLEAFNMSPALIMKKDGSTLYITRDIAAAIYRKETYDFYKNIYVVASQQNLHFQQWIKIIELMGFDWAKQCIHIPFGLVSLEEGTMSTRKGRVVYLEEVLSRAIAQTREIIKEKNVNAENIDVISKQVGIGAVIFQELSNGRIKDYVFSWDKILNFEGETGPYVQYTHARACSVLRNATFDPNKPELAVKDADFSHITGESAYALTKLIYRFPEIVIEAAERYEPSVVTRHIVNIAQAFNRFYHDEHILVADPAEKNAKVLLVHAAVQTLKNGLGLLGMEAPEKM
jgi:arginyl-tRNA synthetase